MADANDEAFVRTQPVVTLFEIGAKCVSRSEARLLLGQLGDEVVTASALWRRSAPPRHGPAACRSHRRVAGCGAPWERFGEPFGGSPQCPGAGSVADLPKRS